MYDLLADDVVGAGADNLVVVERDGMTKVKGLTKKYCASEAEALSFFFAGEANRATASHILNKTSSRSHCIFTIFLESRASGDGAEKTTVSKLNLVDLAGRGHTRALVQNDSFVHNYNSSIVKLNLMRRLLK